MSDFEVRGLLEKTIGCSNSTNPDDYADDATWVLTSSFIILTMQSGFGLLEMGSSTIGNEVHILIKNVADVVFGSMAYWLLGFGLSHGKPSIPFMGLGDFAPSAGNDGKESGIKFSNYLFQFSFAATSTTIVSGCLAMRTKFGVYCIFSFFGIMAYAICTHWYWGDDGWLKTMGVYDFAGGGPVHLFGGMNGLVAIVIIGARTGRFHRYAGHVDNALQQAREQFFIPASPTSQLFGLFMMWWGWIGFNCGSTFGITGDKWVVATRAAIVTINATSGGGICAFLYSLHQNRWKIINVHHVVNGILGSLVATSPTCSVVTTYEAIIIGAIGSLVANYTNVLVTRLHLDDPCGSVGVHLGGGIWGLLAVGLFAQGDMFGVQSLNCVPVRNGLFRGGGFELLGLQIMAIAVTMCWSILFSGSFFYLVGVTLSKDWRNPRKGLRVSIEEELMGADKIMHGLKGDETSSLFGIRRTSSQAQTLARSIRQLTCINCEHDLSTFEDIGSVIANSTANGDEKIDEDMEVENGQPPPEEYLDRNISSQATSILRATNDPPGKRRVTFSA